MGITKLKYAVVGTPINKHKNGVLASKVALLLELKIQLILKPTHRCFPISST